MRINERFKDNQMDIDKSNDQYNGAKDNYNYKYEYNENENEVTCLFLIQLHIRLVSDNYKYEYQENEKLLVCFYFRCISGWFQNSRRGFRRAISDIFQITGISRRGPCFRQVPDTVRRVPAKSDGFQKVSVFRVI